MMEEFLYEFRHIIMIIISSVLSLSLSHCTEKKEIFLSVRTKNQVTVTLSVEGKSNEYQLLGAVADATVHSFFSTALHFIATLNFC